MALLYAPSRGYAGVVKLLLVREEIDSSQVNQWGRSPLSLASKHGHEFGLGGCSLVAVVWMRWMCSA